eukprot:TRINITY_DN5354_c0_g1_i1.p1 TRINITY_DN5354_c0_g1~~TRINITY_DN5354_c0_g1_i1.p1  ORF type:complete len:132 (-),score=29.69 TRINITY_DN5354_c0_g1_i1:79-474(-)
MAYNSYSSYNNNNNRQQMTQPLLQYDGGNTVNDRIVDERNAEMAALSQDLLVLREAMGDLNKLVGEQRDPLESIQVNVESSNVSVQSGNDQLKKAKQYQNRSRRKLCLLGIILLGVIALIVLIILFTKKVI